MLWSKTLETGITKIDEQHKELFKRIDALLDAGNKDRLKETIEFLDSYIVEHFTCEQKMHIDSKYPKATAHKAYHDNYVTTFRKMKGQFMKEGHTLTTSQAVNKNVIDWLKEHIMVHDKEFAAYCKNNGK
ncbi:MAG: bacteriohemerythrin [Synergistaceae bacterium]|jgi:hemerythrin|nr:bacteriohemerythrin [Synergistaceae bacterium]